MITNIDELAILDMEHLAKYTLGDEALEKEILQLFLDQSKLYLERLTTPGHEKEWYDAAHSLKGSARAIGAFKVGKRAEQLERIVEPLHESARCAILVLLQSDLEKTKAEILNHIDYVSSAVFI
jgi:HPt (histidine-containing phosphotransfer) domain-containing protein